MFLAFTNNGPGGRDRPSYYERGIACALDNAIDAHMWFNLAAMDGDERGAPARAGVASCEGPRGRWPR